MRPALKALSPGPTERGVPRQKGLGPRGHSKIEVGGTSSVQLPTGGSGPQLEGRSWNSPGPPSGRPAFYCSTRFNCVLKEAYSLTYASQKSDCSKKLWVSKCISKDSPQKQSRSVRRRWVEYVHVEGGEGNRLIHFKELASTIVGTQCQNLQGKPAG